jgi:hypothetical protein
MDALNGLSGVVVHAGLVVCGLLLAFGIAMSGFESMLGAALGDPSLERAGRGRIVVLTLALALAGSAAAIAAGVAGQLGVANSLGSGMAALTKTAVDALIVLGALLLAVGFAAGGLAGQVAALTGMPHAQAALISRALSLFISFLVTVLAVPLANTIIDTLLH